MRPWRDVGYADLTSVFVDDDRVSISFSSGLTEEEAESLRGALAAASVPASVSDGPYSITAGAEEVIDAFVIVMVLGASAFFTAFLGQAGQDGWEGFKGVVAALRSARTRDAGRTEVIIRAIEGDIVIGPDVPEDALRRLLTEPLPPFPSGRLIYDEDRARWRDSRMS